MKRIKEFIQSFCFLPPVPTVLIVIPAFALVAYVLAAGADGPLAYFAYILSAYGLIIFLTGCWRVISAVRCGIGNHPLAGKVLNAPLGRRLREDSSFRAELSFYRGFAANLLYIILKLASGIYYRSLWFGFLAVYYILLAIMRFLLFFQGKNSSGKVRRKMELHRSRLCGGILLLMNLALAGIVIFMVHHNRGYEYPGTLIYAMAAYSFYAVITAAVNAVKFRRHGSPVLSAAKNINLVAAMVSLLSLETAMLSRFGGNEGPLFRKRMIGYTGGSICLLVLGMAIFMIVNSSKQIKRMENP